MANNANVQKMAETFGDAIKLAANLSGVKRPEADRYSDDSNRAAQQSNPQQTVQIQLPESDKKPQMAIPTIIHDKAETHIHNEFPNDRALTDKECELSLEKAKLQHSLEVQRFEYRKFQDEVLRKDRLAREAQERKDKEEKILREEKKAKRRTIIGSIFAALGVGLVGYSMYQDHKNNQTQHMNQVPQTPHIPLQGEGTVE